MRARCNPIESVLNKAELEWSQVLSLLITHFSTFIMLWQIHFWCLNLFELLSEVWALRFNVILIVLFLRTVHVFAGGECFCLILEKLVTISFTCNTLGNSTFLIQSKVSFLLKWIDIPNWCTFEIFKVLETLTLISLTLIIKICFSLFVQIIHSLGIFTRFRTTTSLLILTFGSVLVAISTAPEAEVRRIGCHIA